MNFRFRMKLKKVSDVIQNKIKQLIRDTFYVYIYKRTLNDFTYKNKSCIRFYEYSGNLRDESILFELSNYHADSEILNNIGNIEEIFDFVSGYIESKFKKYRDMYFASSEDEYGRYFEVGYKNNF